MKKKVFISYSSKDQDKVDYFVRELENNKLFEPLVIAFNREATKLLTEKVINGIRESYCIIPILTTNSINTQWINQEIGFAKGIEKSIIPIIEVDIINELKGFIHKQIDLPYNFTSKDSNRASENKRFVNTVKTLISDLEKTLHPEQEIKEKPKFEETLKIADQLNEKKEFKKKRAEFLNSTEAFERANNEFQRIIDDIENKIKQLEKRKILFGVEKQPYNPVSLLYKTGGYSCSFIWQTKYNNHLKDSFFSVKYWKGYPTLSDDPLYFPEIPPEEIQSYKFKFDIDNNNNIGWYNEEYMRIYQPTEIVDDSFEWILSVINLKNL